jgi:hypothetical protein
MRARRLGLALVAAVCAHAGLALALSRVHGVPPLLSIASSSTTSEELSVEPNELTAEAPSSESDTSRDPNALSRATLVVPRHGVIATAAPARSEPAATPVDDVGHGTPIDEVGNGKTERWSLPRATPIDLGVGTYWKSVVTHGPSESAPARADERSPPAPSASLNRILRDGLAAHDRALGLGSAGPLVSAAHAAASPALAPDVGSATLEFECDAAGRVTTARVIAAATDVPAWSNVAREIVRLMAKRVVHLPSGARGLRAQLRITAERASPSGKKGGVVPGAVPDDVPGTPGGDKVCEGVGLARKCLRGFPVGFTMTGADAANLGANAVRMVRVQILGEATL